MSKFHTTAEVRAILKTAGFNARQVSVRQSSSQTYLTVVVRDPSVDVAKVKSAIKPLHTWSMDQTDYVTGQSVHVETTPEVDAALAAPYIELATELCKKVAESRETSYAIPGFQSCYLMQGHHDRVYSVNKFGADQRGHNVWVSETEDGNTDAIKQIALQISQICA